jgi:hypothetical protein
MRHVKIAAAVVAVAVAVVTAPAQAAQQEIARMPASEPRFAGDSIVFLSSDGGTQRLMQVRPGSSPAPIEGFSAPSSQRPYVRASSGALAVVPEIGSAGASLYTGPSAGPLSPLFECNGESAFRQSSTPGTPPFDVDGDRLAYLAHPCPEGPGKTEVIVRDLGSPGAPVVERFTPEKEFAWGLDLAGGLLALYGMRDGLDTAGVGVYDLDGNQRGFGSSANFFSLQPDGKVASAYIYQFQGCNLSWNAPDGSSGSVPGACARGQMAMAGDRIAYRAREQESSPETLEVATLDGTRTVRATAAVGGLLSEVDFDGTRLVYAVAACTVGNSLIVDDLQGPSVKYESRCPVRITGKPVPATGSGLVQVRLACSAGCQGVLDLRRGKRSVVKRTGTAVQEEAGRVLVPLRLTASVRRELRRQGSLSASALFRVRTRNGGVFEERRAVRLLAPSK